MQVDTIIRLMAMVPWEKFLASPKVDTSKYKFSATKHVQEPVQEPVQKETIQEPVQKPIQESIQETTSTQKPTPVHAEIQERERQGDYCLPCIPSKHLMRVKDALADALNILNAQGKFTDVAEGKIQRAVYELNSAEVDFEMANIPEEIKIAAEDMHKQVRAFRNFLRSDQSGLEVCTLITDIEKAKTDLSSALNMTDGLIKAGYGLTKILIKARMKNEQ